MTVRHILWDNDGVLVDSEPWYYRATAKCVQPLGVDLALGEYVANMVTGGDAWAQARALGASEADIVAQRNERNRLYAHYLQTENIDIPGALDTVRHLADTHDMAIVTTSRRDHFDVIHEPREFLRHMAFVLAHGDYPRAKPAPDPYLTALERFRAHADDAIAVEDSERGLRAAVAAGLRCIVVRNAFTADQDFSAAHARIDDLRELPDVLRTLT